MNEVKVKVKVKVEPCEMSVAYFTGEVIKSINQSSFDCPLPTFDFRLILKIHFAYFTRGR